MKIDTNKILPTLLKKYSTRSEAGNCIVEYLFLISFISIITIGGLGSLQNSMSSKIDQLLTLQNSEITIVGRPPGGGGSSGDGFTGEGNRSKGIEGSGGGSDGTIKTAPGAP